MPQSHPQITSSHTPSPSSRKRKRNPVANTASSTPEAPDAKKPRLANRGKKRKANGTGDDEYAEKPSLRKTQRILKGSEPLDPLTVEALESIVYRSTRPKRERVPYGEAERVEYMLNEEKPIICTWDGMQEVGTQESVYAGSQNLGEDLAPETPLASLANSDLPGTTTLTNIDHLMDLILQSKHVVFFTGSGISKSAGLATYRDDANGIYEQIKRGERDQHNQFFDEDKIYLPTRTHMAIARLMELNKAHYIITQNCDNLHLKSNVPWSKIIELHGNMYLLKCNKCKSTFEMDEVQQQPLFVHHKEIVKRANTARVIHGKKCYNCGSEDTLEHTITNFGEPIEQNRWDIAHEEAERADLMIVLGSSCAVSPANLLPPKAKRVVICNLNATPLDHDADIICRNVTSDAFMEQIFKHMGIDIPSYELTIPLVLGMVREENGTTTLKIKNFDDMENYVDRIVLRSGEEGLEIELNHENEFTHAVDGSGVKWSITAHLAETGQLSEENHVVEVALEERLPSVGEEIQYTLVCLIHEETPKFVVQKEEKGKEE